MAQRDVSILVLYNKDKEILLQHRAKEAKRLPDHWAFFGGGIEEGESPEEALKRELFEELEYQVSKPVLVTVQQFDYQGVVSKKHVYVEKFDQSQPLVLHEGQGMGWYKFSDLDGLKIVDHDRVALNRIQEFLFKP